MRIAGDNCVDMFLCGGKQNTLELIYPALRSGDGFTQEQTFIQSHLVIPAPSRVDLPPDGPDNLRQPFLSIWQSCGPPIWLKPAAMPRPYIIAA